MPLTAAKMPSANGRLGVAVPPGVTSTSVGGSVYVVGGTSEPVGVSEGGTETGWVAVLVGVPLGSTLGGVVAVPVGVGSDDTVGEPVTVGVVVAVGHASVSSPVQGLWPMALPAMAKAMSKAAPTAKMCVLIEGPPC